MPCKNKGIAFNKSLQRTRVTHAPWPILATGPLRFSVIKNENEQIIQNQTRSYCWHRNIYNNK